MRASFHRALFTSGATTMLWALTAVSIVSAAPIARQEETANAVSSHVVKGSGKPIRYDAQVEQFDVNDGSGKAGARLVTTSYIRSDVGSTATRPVIFLFNGGPSAAAIGVHEQFGPLARCLGVASEGKVCGNPHTILDVADLVMFDPVETGFSRMLPGGNRDYFYSTDGDADALAQLVDAWLIKHKRTSSPRYLLGESYGSIRQVVTGRLLEKRGLPLNGQIILGDSTFLMETSRRSRNVISSAVSLPLLALTAAYHGKVDRGGKTDAEFLDEAYAFAMGDYLLALSRGYELTPAERQAMAGRLQRYTGIPRAYFLANDLAIAKQEFNRLLLPGKVLDRNDSRVATHPPMPGAARGAPYAAEQAFYTSLMRGPLRAGAMGQEYVVFAPESFERWDWGAGCSSYVGSAGLCKTDHFRRTVFVDYDWPDLLKLQFENPKFRVMIVSGYYDGLSSVGTHRYLRAQLGYPADRFELHEYAGGHMTAGDPIAQPKVMADVRAFLTK